MRIIEPTIVVALRWRIARRWIGMLAAAVVVGLASAHAASAASIGLNFYKDASGNLDTADTAGLPAVAQSHWNTLLINSGTDVPLSDDAGQATTATVTYSSGNASYATGRTQGFTGANAKLFTQELYTNPTVTLSNIPYASYDIYVYIDSDSADRGQSTALNSPVGGTIDTATYYQTPYQITGAGGSAINGNFLLGTNTDGTLADFSNGRYPLANYLLFTGNTADGLTLHITTGLTYGPSGLAGIQIVEVPEPASIALLGLGVAAMVRRRWA